MGISYIITCDAALSGVGWQGEKLAQQAGGPGPEDPQARGRRTGTLLSTFSVLFKNGSNIYIFFF